MNSTERVRNLILGKPYDRQPIYGWVYGNLTWEIDNVWGSLAGFEKKYEFDMAHLFSGPLSVRDDVIGAIREEVGELTPDILLERAGEVWTDPDCDVDYDSVRRDLAYYKAQHERFCYIQTPGILEHFNGIFGIQNHLMYLLLYPEELMALYARQAEWTKHFVRHVTACGVDMVHISDDWGSQKEMLISPSMWREMIYPYLKQISDEAHLNGSFCSLHSDGCITKALDGVVDLGIDLLHPWQENANMPYDIYLDKYQDKFAIMGGINVQNALGIMPRDELEKDIYRVFNTLRGKKWVVCTTHFVQKHCSVEDLGFAFDLIYKLARE